MSAAIAARAPVSPDASSIAAAADGFVKSTQAKSAPLFPSRSHPVLPLAVVAAGHPEVFTAGQTAILTRLGEEFLAATEKSPVLPGRPATAPSASAATGEDREWNQAQISSDARFRSMFGYGAYNALLLERAREPRTVAP